MSEKPAGPGILVAIILVAAGTALGAVARGTVGAFLGQPHSVAGYTTIFTVNIVGAFVLGLITELTLGPRSWQPAARLALGTGFCGGFTTYSTFAVDVAIVQTEGPAIDVALYLAGMLVVGVPAALSGIAFGEFLRLRSVRKASGESAARKAVRG
ncbi:fluoride efflux transporter FluC [Dietzia sp.]|uniref:fluoride efflux transporter FluC n=1 Tax=Dietzia sp. TaxID=1871616 RepID=UPI002FD8A2EC